MGNGGLYLMIFITPILNQIFFYNYKELFPKFIIKIIILKLLYVETLILQENNYKKKL